MWQNADVPRSDVPPLPHKSNLVVENPTTPYTTPGKSDMWQNADLPRSDVPHSIKPSGTEALLHQVSLTCGRMQTYPGQMYPFTC